MSDVQQTGGVFVGIFFSWTDVVWGARSFCSGLEARVGVLSGCPAASTSLAVELVKMTPASGPGWLGSGQRLLLLTLPPLLFVSHAAWMTSPS